MLKYFYQFFYTSIFSFLQLFPFRHVLIIIFKTLMLCICIFDHIFNCKRFNIYPNYFIPPSTNKMIKIQNASGANSHVNHSLSDKQIKDKLFQDPDFIKKSKINYFNCQRDGLHQGQKQVLVCLDTKCKNKGLICPVCRQQQHKDHEVIHLKIFLTQLQNRLVKRPSPDESESGNGQKTQQAFKTKTLSDHLILLQNARKNIIQNLQQCVKTLAQSVKDIEKKIQEQYVRIRKVILSQKSFESRLPKIYNTLLTQNNQNSQNKQQIKQQIKKLTDLLQKNSKQNTLKVASEVDKVVQLYVSNSQKCTTHLLSLMTDLPKKITDLPIKLKNIILDSSQDQKKQETKIQYKFSDTLKPPSLLLSEDKKSVSILGPDQIGGLVFIQSQANPSQIRKVNLKIASSVSDSISLGVGDVQKMKQVSFIVQQMQNDGLYGICAMGININDIQSPTFVFSQGDIIEIAFHIKQSKIIFGRRNGVQKQQIDLELSSQECKKLKFFVSLLLYGDSVEIVE